MSAYHGIAKIIEGQNKWHNKAIDHIKKFGYNFTMTRRC